LDHKRNDSVRQNLLRRAARRVTRQQRIFSRAQVVADFARSPTARGGIHQNPVTRPIPAEVSRLQLRCERIPNHHCGGGAYGATGATGAPNVAGAVVQGLHTGGGQGGGHAATGAGRRSHGQQQQPALTSAGARIAKSSDFLVMLVSPYFLRNIRQKFYGMRGQAVRSCKTQVYAANANTHAAKIGHSTIPGH